MAFWNRKKPILRVLLQGTEVAKVMARDLPCEFTPDLHWTDDSPTLEMVDSSDQAFSYDLSSVTKEGYRYGAFSFRVGENHAVQTDCLLGIDSAPTQEEFSSGEAKGLRLQPFFLPESKADPADLAGRGLFYRGLHFSGTITPGNVSLLCVCDACSKSFRVQSFHTGFGNQAYFYCNKSPHTLIINNAEDGAPAALSEPDREALRRLEERLPACAACGGSFSYANAFRCPWCSEPYIDFQKHPSDRVAEYYGNFIYGTEPQRWSSG